ncbi:MAG: DUF5916 domain-containing protein [bacterium]|nr:DUF5916 domain-containing protein [bacterium]
MRLPRLVPILLILPLLRLAAGVGDTPPPVQAVRLDCPVTVDGLLSEPVWSEAPAVSAFFQRDPDEGKPATQETVVRIVYDDDALYVGAEMRDTAPDSIVARVSRRDNIDNEDHFAIGIDSYHDKRSAFYFGLSAGGTLSDGTFQNDDWQDDTWDGVWEGRVHRDGRGWTAEMRIPFSQLRFRREEKNVWGVNYYRALSRRNEESYLVFTPKNSSGFVSRFPDLVGIENIKPTRRVEVLPYARAKAAYTHPDAGNPFDDGSSWSPVAGADLKVGLSNNMTLDLTANPDFGQVEVDPAVVNLSDVETYFEEKRPFFIEGSSIFNFGMGGANNYWGFNWSNPNFFYSRRIGRPTQGSLPDHDYADTPEGVRILGAAKVTGKIGGKWNVGAVQALTKREFADLSLGGEKSRSEVEPLATYGIVRAQREIRGGRQGIGFLSTLSARRFDESRLKPDFNRHSETFGIDGWTFLDTSKTWVLAGWAGASRVAGSPERITSLQRNSQHYFQRPDVGYLGVDSAATEMKGWAGRFYLNKQRGNVIVNSAVGFVSPGFDVNDAGFMSRADVINGHVGGGYLWTKPGKIFRFHDVIGAVFQSSDFGGNVFGRGIFVLWENQFLNYWRLDGHYCYNPQTMNKYRTRGGPLTVGHDGSEYELEIESDDRKPLVFEVGGYAYFSTPVDWYRSVFASLQWKPRSNMSLSVGPGLSRIREYTQWVDAFDDPTAVRTYGKRYVFAEMDQTEISANVRLNWTFTPRLSFQLYMQPLSSHGDYEKYKELRKPRSYSFDEYAPDRILRANGEYEIDPDGPGPAESFLFDNPDFNFKSLRGNAVLRWEYRPGSTLYLVWTQNRWDDRYDEPYSFRKSMSQLGDAKADNIFMLKATYWWSL